MSVVVGAIAVAALLFVTASVLIWKAMSSTRVRRVDPAWLKKFSVSSYRPMERLLSEDDIRFLKSQPGYEPGMVRTLRRNRRKAFRLYLKNLALDFNRLHYALRLVALHGATDDPELAKTLIKQKLVFVAGLLAVRMRLELYALGIGSVNVDGLLATLETMQSELRGLALTPAASPAVL